uniref:Olduvai domain-containing protein n=1 Tax=Sus scrofa TaxID=9823 RepID=A0A8D0RDU6_PIG
TLDNGPQACDPGPQSEFSLLGSTKHLRSQLAQCRQRYQDLQEKLLISEATVFAQANQLEKYRAKKDLESLIQRVSQLEAQLPKTGTEGKLAEELRSASWPGKYDSLIQDQARELSYLRQKIREGRGICYLLTQHAKDTVKSFEDLLRSNDIDYYLGQSFREQLAQGSQLTERLTSKLSTSKLATGLWDILGPSHSSRPWWLPCLHHSLFPQVLLLLYFQEPLQDQDWPVGNTKEEP